MASRSKKIMELINMHSASPTDPCRNENVAQSSNQEVKMNLEYGNDQNTTLNVVVLSDVTNRPENQSYTDVNTFFETEKLSNRICGGRKTDNYKTSPVNSYESEADLNDHDITFDHQNKKKKMPTVYPTPRRLSSSSSSSTSSSSSSSTSSSSSSSSSSSKTSLDDPNTKHENLTTAPQHSNTLYNSVTTANEEPSEVQETAQINQECDASLAKIEEETDICKKRGRKRNSNREKWRQNVNKMLRNTGYSYETKNKEIVPPREVQLPCTERCRLKCKEYFTPIQRQALFDAFWAIGDIDKQRLFINSCMSNVSPRYKYTNALRPRQSNKAFHFTMDDKTIRVCKTFFIGTLNISDRMIRTVKQKCDKLGVIHRDRRGTHNNHRNNDQSLIANIKKFIDSIPRIESHYTRQTSTREYFDGAKNITDLFKDFKETQEKSNQPYGKYCTFYNVFTKEYNISFHYPRKDQCDLCLQYENSNNEQKNLIREKFNAHIDEKTLSRQEKYNDRCKINDKNKVIVFDLQAVLQSPRGNTSAFYYKSKLNSYNFTVTLLNRKVQGQMKDAYSDVHSYFWNETDAKRGANEIGSCLLDCFKNICRESRPSEDSDDLNLILYSDNCTGQNKNKYIVASYLYAVTNFNITSITHKFLVKGHTQNEGDNIHSLIEKEIKKNLKSGPIYIPHQYVTMIKNAKKSGKKFFVHECTYDSFFDLKKLQDDWGYNFNETEDKKCLNWNDIKIIKCEKSEPFAFFVKTSYKDNEFTKICVRNKRKKMKILSELTPEKAYTGKRKLSENKKRDLKELVDKNLIPNFYNDFYNTLF